MNKYWDILSCFNVELFSLCVTDDDDDVDDDDDDDDVEQVKLNTTKLFLSFKNIIIVLLYYFTF